MPVTAKPREQESTAPSTGSGTPPSAPSRQEKEAPVIWPRDLNSISTDKLEWGSDPERLRDA